MMTPTLSTRVSVANVRYCIREKKIKEKQQQNTLIAGLFWQLFTCMTSCSNLANQETTNHHVRREFPAC